MHRKSISRPKIQPTHNNSSITHRLSKKHSRAISMDNSNTNLAKRMQNTFNTTRLSNKHIHSEAKLRTSLGPNPSEAELQTNPSTHYSKLYSSKKKRELSLPEFKLSRTAVSTKLIEDIQPSYQRSVSKFRTKNTQKSEKSEKIRKHNKSQLSLTSYNKSYLELENLNRQKAKLHNVKPALTTYSEKRLGELKKALTVIEKKYGFKKKDPKEKVPVKLNRIDHRDPSHIDFRLQIGKSVKFKFKKIDEPKFFKVKSKYAIFPATFMVRGTDRVCETIVSFKQPRPTKSSCMMVTRLKKFEIKLVEENKSNWRKDKVFWGNRRNPEYIYFTLLPYDNTEIIVKITFKGSRPPRLSEKELELDDEDLESSFDEFKHRRIQETLKYDRFRGIKYSEFMEFSFNELRKEEDFFVESPKKTKKMLKEEKRRRIEEKKNRTKYLNRNLKLASDFKEYARRKREIFQYIHMKREKKALVVKKRCQEARTFKFIQDRLLKDRRIAFRRRLVHNLLIVGLQRSAMFVWISLFFLVRVMDEAVVKVDNLEKKRELAVKKFMKAIVIAKGIKTWKDKFKVGRRNKDLEKVSCTMRMIGQYTYKKSHILSREYIGIFLNSAAKKKRLFLAVSRFHKYALISKLKVIRFMSYKRQCLVDFKLRWQLMIQKLSTIGKSNDFQPLSDLLTRAKEISLVERTRIFELVYLAQSIDALKYNLSKAVLRNMDYRMNTLDLEDRMVQMKYFPDYHRIKEYGCKNPIKRYIPGFTLDMLRKKTSMKTGLVEEVAEDSKEVGEVDHEVAERLLVILRRNRLRNRFEFDLKDSFLIEFIFSVYKIDDFVKRFKEKQMAEAAEGGLSGV